MTDWSDVQQAVEEHARAYSAMLTTRETAQVGSKKDKQAYETWLAAHTKRAEALMNHWTEEDGMFGEFRRMGPVLQRYYRETYKPKKGGKR